MPEKTAQSRSVQQLRNGLSAQEPQQNGEEEWGEIDPLKRNF